MKNKSPYDSPQLEVVRIQMESCIAASGEDMVWQAPQDPFLFSGDSDTFIF